MCFALWILGMKFGKVQLGISGIELGIGLRKQLRVEFILEVRVPCVSEVYLLVWFK